MLNGKRHNPVQMLMSRIILSAGIVWMAACAAPEEEPSPFTGNEVSYPLLSGSEWGFEGTVTFREKTDLTTQVEVNIAGTEGTRRFPVHLHYGPYNEVADLAALLAPLSAASGTSDTEVEMLADETPILYRDLIAFDGHIKVHLSDAGPAKDVILAYGNIGSNASMPMDLYLAKCYGPEKEGL